MEPRKRKTLLDLDRLPTQKELREFFLANDWSARKPYDFDKWSQEKIEDKNYTQNIFDKIWHKISRKHGQKASPRCYTKDYPPEVLRSNVSDIVSGSVTEMVNEHPEVVQSIFDNLSDEFLSGGLLTIKAVMTSQEIDDPQALTEEDIAKVDRFVDNAMDTLMNTVDYDTLVQVCREFGAPEDFSDIKTNYPRTEFEEKYDHTKAKTKVTFSTLAADYAMDVERINSYSPEELAVSSALVADFYEELDEIDLAILKLKIEGKTLEEIADVLGFKTHSAIHKRMKRIQQQYLDFDPDFRKEYNKKYKNKKVS